MITEIGLESAEARREAAEKNVMYRMTFKYALKFLSIIAIGCPVDWANFLGQMGFWLIGPIVPIELAQTVFLGQIKSCLGQIKSCLGQKLKCYVIIPFV